MGGASRISPTNPTTTHGGRGPLGGRGRPCVNVGGTALWVVLLVGAALRGVGSTGRTAAVCPRAPGLLSAGRGPGPAYLSHPRDFS